MLGLLRLVNKFEKELEISKVNALWRVGLLFLLLFSLVPFVFFSIIFFPSLAKFEDKIPMLPGSHVQVNKLSEDVLVGKDQFLRIARNSDTFICLNKKTISYMIKEKETGLKYGYEDIYPISWCSSITSQRIQDGFVVLERKLETGLMVVYLIILLVIALLLCVSFQNIQHKSQKHSSYYKAVWF